MGAADFIRSGSGHLAFECDRGILGDSPDRAGGTVSPASAGTDGAFTGCVFQNLFLPAWYCTGSDGMYSADRQLLYSLSVHFSDESFLWIYTVTAQLSVWTPGDFVHAGLLMSTIFHLYSVDDFDFERGLIPNGQGFSGQFEALGGDFLHNNRWLWCGKLYKPCDFKNRFKKFFLTKIKILGRYYVNKPYIVFCYKNENLRNIFVKNVFDFLNNYDYN